MEQAGAVRAFFNDDAFEAEGHESLAGCDTVVGAGEQLCFAIVDDEAVDAFYEGEKGVTLGVDPVVDGICDDEGVTAELIADLVLQIGADVA